MAALKVLLTEEETYLLLPAQIPGPPPNRGLPLGLWPQLSHAPASSSSDRVRSL